MTDIKTVGKHTPGPWTVGGDNVVYDEKHRDPICDTSFRCDEVSSANSKLIAAAPDLLEALEEIMSSYDPYEPICEENAQLARKAIARARGES